jgi:hypothetical protein
MLITCPCGKTLRVDDALANKRVRCPACQAVLLVPGMSVAIQTQGRVGSTAPPASPPPAGAEENRPGRRREEEEDARPRRDRRYEDDEDDWEEERPRRKKRRKRHAGPSPLVWVLAGGGVLLLMVVVVIVLALIVRGGVRGGANLQEFASAEGRFKVLMPRTPKQQNQGAAGMVLKAFLVEDRDGAYMAAFMDMPIPANEPEAQIEVRLNGGRDGAIQNLNGRLVREGRVKLDGKYLGRDFEADVPNKKMVLRARFYIVGSRMYQVMVMGTRAYAHSTEATRFLESLTLTN